MIIDNFNNITPWFENLLDQGDFYFVQIIQRKKECDVGSNNNVIKNYAFYNVEQLNKYKDEIKTLCKTFNARAYFWVNPRNTKQIQFEILRECSEAIECNSFKLFKLLSKSIGQRRNSNYKAKWILDFDTKDINTIESYLDIINKCRPGEQEFQWIETLNGWHIICKGFDINQFKQKLAIKGLDNIDIHRDNPTVLYYEHN